MAIFYGLNCTDQEFRGLLAAEHKYGQKILNTAIDTWRKLDKPVDNRYAYIVGIARKLKKETRVMEGTGIEMQTSYGVFEDPDWLKRLRREIDLCVEGLS